MSGRHERLAPFQPLLAMIETSIVIPTYRRPEHLARAVASCLAQQGEVGRFEIVVVDNDAAGSAEAAVAAMAQAAPVPIRYVAEKRPGISHARNAGVANAAGRYLAFLDDDEEAEPGWLAAFLATIRRCGADAVIGPVYPLFPAGAPLIDAYRRKVFTRDARMPTGTPLVKWSGIGNTLLDKAKCFATPEPFDPRLGLSGGEDTVFLRQLLRRGRRIVWCAEAAAHETVAVDKLTTRFLLRRAFRGGQTTTFLCTAVEPPEPARAALWMAIGCAQLLLYAPAALLLRALKRERWLPVMVKAVGGLGKVFWHPRLHLRLYR
jgi:succinoglycan biosynthesis protein ExoM